jgi:hypothetical protein
MLTLLEAVLLVCLISMLFYWRLSQEGRNRKERTGRRVVALEREQKNSEMSLRCLSLSRTPLETQLPLTQNKATDKSLEDRITVTRYLDTIFPE